METDSFKIFNLERHDTKDITDKHVNGELTVIWRDWDNHELVSPKMIYITSVKPNEKRVLIFILKEIVSLHVYRVK